MKKFLLFTSSLTACTLYGVIGYGAIKAAHANPEDGIVSAGTATINNSIGRVDIQQSSDKAVIDWRRFNIDQGETTQFHQPSASSLTVNRIHDTDPSKILGNLKANGNIVLINQNGILFGKDAVVDVGGLVATTSDISNTKAMAGQLDFDVKGAPDASVINEGTITARDAGLVGLVAPQVENRGVITAKLGKVHLGSAEKFTLDLYGDGKISVAANETISRQIVANTGTINAEGGVVQLTASAGANLVSSLIQVDGEIKVPQASAEGGKIIISGNDQTAVSITGQLDASGASGGQVSVAGKNIIQQGQINASGTNGQGGTVAVTFKNAYLDNEASKISATGHNANGGTVSVNGDTRSTAFVSGQYDVSSTTHTGGTVQMTTDDGDLKLYGAKVSAHGKTQGGKINIGGAYQGTGTLKQAKTTSINYATTLNADATDSGKGGEVIVWSKDQTLFGGTAQARGGVNGGDGGLIEISSKDTMKIADNAITSAAARQAGYLAGTLLLDPKNITIATGGITEGGISYFEIVDPNVDTGGFGGFTIVLTNGNVVVTDTLDDFIATNSGAVYLFNGATGGLISTLTGTIANDQVGTSGVTALTNGNFTIASRLWDNGAAINAGAATWASGTTGISGFITAANSLVGTTTGDLVGNGFVTALTNGNYVVRSSSWINGGLNSAGAVTWGNGLGGTVGAVSATNSLVGGSAADGIGAQGITVLNNGNYLVASGSWRNGAVSGAGAITWGNGLGGTVGLVSASNSLVGSTLNDLSLSTIIQLTNGNYVIRAPQWDDGATANVGSVTWGSGTAGVSGVISATNSLIGSTANDTIGSAVVALSNGNYVVGSNMWNNGATADVGAVTWVNGSTGMVGTVTAANSLIGSTANDQLGQTGSIVALTNGNYVIGSQLWDNGGVGDAGAATWGNGLGGTVGTITAANSLVGSRASDNVGKTILALTNGNYVIGSPNWDNGAGVSNAGAATWGNGLGGTVGAVSAVNSLIGNANDQVALGNGASQSFALTALTNGNYVVLSGNWNGQLGAITWGDGATGTTGLVSAANSLIGTNSLDMYSAQVTPLTNGNYVSTAQLWDNGAVNNAGAVTWGNGSGGTVGNISTANSLVGTVTQSVVGSGGIIALTNGNYVVSSPQWDNGAITDVGAATWGNGTTGTIGTVSAANSLIGSVANDNVGGVIALPSGDYIAQSNNWDNGAISNAGAFTLGNGMGGTVGMINSTNSILGTVAGAFWLSPRIDTVNGRAVLSNLVSLRVFSMSLAFDQLGNYNNYTDLASSNVTLSPTFITSVVNAGTGVVLQANNDITVNNNIIANNASGNGGDLTLQAGRSILINANISSDNGNLYLLGNQKLSTGVVDAHRDAGNAVIAMANGTSINAGTGDVVIRLDDGAGLTNHGAGDISLAGITANHILVQNVNATGDIVLNSGSQLTAGGTGTAITLASARHFINNSGASALSAGSGRWLVYSTNPANDTIGSLSNNFRRFSCTYGGSCPTFGTTGNGFLYTYTPVLTVTPDAIAAIQYGDAVPTLTGYAYNASGYLSGTDASDDVLSGTLTGTTTYTAGSNVNSYNVNYASGTLTSSLGYGFTYGNNSTAITVNRKDITASFNTALSKIYGDANPTIDHTNFTFSSLVGSDTSSLFTSITPNFGSVGANTGVSTGNVVTAAIGNTSNYNITNTPSTTLAITPRALTVVTNAASKTLPAADPTFTGSDNLTAYDAGLISWAYTPIGYSGSQGTYLIGANATDPSSRLANYSRTNNYSNFTVYPDPSVVVPPTPTPTPTPSAGLPDTVVYMGLGGYLNDVKTKLFEVNVAGEQPTKENSQLATNQTIESELTLSELGTEELIDDTPTESYSVRITRRLKQMLQF